LLFVVAVVRPEGEKKPGRFKKELDDIVTLAGVCIPDMTFTGETIESLSGL
jgi:hypothetical protein